MQQMYLQQQNQNNLNQLVNNSNNNNNNNFNQKQGDDNIDLVLKVKNILKEKESEERSEMLGETLFYFLLDFINTFKLNISLGKFDDTFLCSKLTGILMHTEENQLIEIIRNSEILKLTIQDVIKVKYII